MGTASTRVLSFVAVVDMPARYPTSVPRSFFFNDTATTEIYTLSLHDALPISSPAPLSFCPGPCIAQQLALLILDAHNKSGRSEEHTSELQSRQYLVCRLLLEKKSTPATSHSPTTATTYPTTTKASSRRTWTPC